jgi:hypothetical protein
MTQGQWNTSRDIDSVDDPSNKPKIRARRTWMVVLAFLVVLVLTVCFYALPVAKGLPRLVGGLLIALLTFSFFFTMMWLYFLCMWLFTRMKARAAGHLWCYTCGRGDLRGTLLIGSGRPVPDPALAVHGDVVQCPRCGVQLRVDELRSLWEQPIWRE